MKKSGKVLSLVLSLALVASSIPMAFASAAATKTESLGVDVSDHETNLVNGASGSKSLTDTSIPVNVTGVTYDHLKVADMKATDVSYKSGRNVVTPLFKDDKKDDIQLKVTDDNAVGSEVIAVRYTKETNRYSDPSTQILFSVEVDYTVNVYKNDSYSITMSKPVAKNAKAAGSTVTGTINQWSLQTTNTDTITDRTAVATPAKDVMVDGAKDAVTTAEGLKADGTSPAPEKSFIVKTASKGGNEVTVAGSTNGTFTATITRDKSNKTDFLAVGSATFYATQVTKAAVKADADNNVKGNDATLDTANTLVSYAQVANRVELGTLKAINTWHGITWATDGTSMPAESLAGDKYDKDAALPVDTVKPMAGALNVSNCPVELGAAATTMSNGSVGAVIGNGKDFKVDKGTVASITDVLNLKVDGGAVSGSVDAGSVDVESGTVGNIVASAVTVQSTDEKVPAKTGSIEGNIITVKADKSSAVTGTVTKTGLDGTVESGPADETANEITLLGSPTVGAIDLDYYKTTVDLKGFSGTIAAPKNAASSSLTTDVNGNTHTDATLTGSAVFDTMTVNDSDKVTVANDATANLISGIGTLVIPAGKLTVNTSINTVSLKLSSSNIAAGETVLKAPAYSVYDGSFKTVGYTIDYDAVNAGTKTGLQEYKVKDVTFAGLTITPVDAKDNKIVKGQKETYKVSVYPDATKLPADSVIKITFNGSSDNFNAVVNSDNTITVEAKGYSDLFSSLNKGTITAAVVDKDDNTIEKFGFDKANYDVEVVKEAPAPVASFTIDSLPKSMNLGQSYTVAITSADGTKPTYAFADGAAVITSTSVSGKKTFVTFTAAKSGTHGFWVSGKRMASLVVSNNSIADTKTVTKKAGQTYKFKTVSPTVPTFAIAGVGHFTPSSVTKTSAGYVCIFTVKATNAKGAHGVWANGVRIGTFYFA